MWHDTGVKVFYLALLCSLVYSQELGDVRLLDGRSSSEGRVEVFTEAAEWERLCDDKWDEIGADIVCRQLGFLGADVALIDSPFGDGAQSATIKVDNCNADAADLLSGCSTRDGGRKCRKNHDAGVVCTAQPTPTPLGMEFAGKTTKVTLQTQSLVSTSKTTNRIATNSPMTQGAMSVATSSTMKSMTSDATSDSTRTITTTTPKRSTVASTRSDATSVSIGTDNSRSRITSVIVQTDFFRCLLGTVQSGSISAGTLLIVIIIVIIVFLRLRKKKKPQLNQRHGNNSEDDSRYMPMSPRAVPPNNPETSEGVYQYPGGSGNISEDQYFAAGATTDGSATPSAPPLTEIVTDEGFYIIPVSSTTNPYQELNVKSNNFEGLQKVKREPQPRELHQETPSTPKMKKPPPVMQKPPRNFKALSKIPPIVNKAVKEEKGYPKSAPSGVDEAVNEETYDLVGTITKSSIDLNNPTYDPSMPMEPSKNSQRINRSTSDDTYDIVGSNTEDKYDAVGTINRTDTDMDNPTYEVSLDKDQTSNEMAKCAVNDDENQTSIYVNNEAIQRMASIRSQTIPEDGEIGGEYADPDSLGICVDAADHPYVNTRIGSMSGSFRIEEKDLHCNISRKATLPV